MSDDYVPRGKPAKAPEEEVPVWKILVIVATPFALLPLPIILACREANCAYVALLMTVYWITEALPLPVTALLPIPLYPLLGVQSAAVTAANYFVDTNFLIFGSLLLAVATEKSGLQKRIALRVLVLFGARPQWLILGFMLTAGFVTMWISSTATCAMMIPIVVVVLEEILSQRRLSANGGGTNVERTGRSFFKGPLSPEELGICRAAFISVAFSSSVGGIGALPGASPNLILSGQLDQYYPTQQSVTFASWFAFGMPMQLLFLATGWLWLLLLFTGWKSIIRCCSPRTESEMSSANSLKREYEKLGPIRFEEAVIAFIFALTIFLWLFREPVFIKGWGDYFITNFASDSTPVILVGTILFACPRSLTQFKIRKNISPSELPVQERKSRFKFNMSYQPLMTWDYLQEKLPWSVIILMGGGFALADGIQRSGLSQWLGCSLQSNLRHLQPTLVVLIFLTMMTFISEFASNSATASVFVPILLTVAESLNIHPLYFGLSAAIGSSFGFMLPVATPPNMIVFEKGKQLGILSPADVIKAGLGLDIICILVAFAIIHTTGDWIYHFDTYPEWGRSAVNFTRC